MNRIDGLGSEQVDDAFVERTLVKGSLADCDHNIAGRTAAWWPKLLISSTHIVQATN